MFLVKHVINYNLPTNPEDYVHRVGRTVEQVKKVILYALFLLMKIKNGMLFSRFLNQIKK